MLPVWKGKEGQTVDALKDTSVDGMSKCKVIEEHRKYCWALEVHPVPCSLGVIFTMWGGGKKKNNLELLHLKHSGKKEKAGCTQVRLCLCRYHSRQIYVDSMLVE